MLSAIVLSFNTREITLKCLADLSKSLHQLEKEAHIASEIIVVDNNSDDGSAEAIKKQFKEVKLIANKENKGFGTGNNQAMKQARGDWLLLLNSDAFVTDETLIKLFDFAESTPQADVIGCKILNPDGSLQSSIGYFPTLPRILLWMTFIHNWPLIRTWVPAIHVRDSQKYKKTCEVDWVTGAIMMLKKEVFTVTGGFDENFHMYGEETEWEYRIKMKGYHIYYYPGTSVVHLVAASTKSKSKMYLGEMRGFIYWYKKHEPKWKQTILPYILLWGSLLKGAVWNIAGNKENARANFEVYHALKTS